MYKIIIIFLFHSLLILEAKEPTLAMLKNVYANDSQKFSIGNGTFLCKPYGVKSLEKMYASSKKDSICKKSIYELYQKSKPLAYYSLNLLYVSQFYHVEFKNEKCLLFAKGEKTLSELLLENGLALVNPSFNDEEFQWSFYHAQRGAKENKRGLWSKDIYRECFEELNKK